MSKIIDKIKVGDNVAYLKKQDDGRFTINAGHTWDSGWDMWFSSESVNEKQAKSEFKDIFIDLWFDPSIFIQDKLDLLHQYDIYTLDQSEIEDYD